MVQLVLASDLKPSGLRLVALCMAWHASDDTGECWPSLGTLAREAGVTRARVKQCVKEMLSSSVLQVAARGDEKQLAAQSSKIWPGFSVLKITDDVRQQLDLGNADAGLVIGAVDQGGPADVAGLKSGDLITKVGGREVRNLADFYKALNNPDAKEILFTVQRQANSLIIGLVR